MALVAATAELRAAEPKIALLRANHLRDGMIPHVVERHGLTLTLE